MKRKIVFCTLLTIIGLLLQPIQAAQAKTISYNTPLAYIGEDGNVYVTSIGAGAGTRLTNDAKVPDPIEKLTVCEDCAGTSESYRRYGSIRWSPDGTSFAFIERYSGQLFVVESGKSPRLLNPKVRVGSLLGHLVIGWSPDGKQIVYGIGNAGGPQELAVVTVADGSITPITGDLSGAASGDGPRPDDIAIKAYYDELGSAMFATSTSVYWTDYGFLYTTSSIGLADAEGNIVWHHDADTQKQDQTEYQILYAKAVPMPDGKTAVAFQTLWSDTKSITTPILVDLASGEITPIKDLSMSFTIWSYGLMPDGKTIVYESTNPGGAIKGDPNSTMGKTLFPDYWPLDGVTYAVSLWRQSLSGGKPVPLFTKDGYDVAIIAPSPDNSGAAISFVTDSSELAKKINANNSRAEILAAFPHSEVYYVNLISGQPQFIARGGQPAFGKGPFAAVPAE